MIALVIGVTVSVGMSLASLLRSNDAKIAYFDIDKVYEGYQMKKDLESKVKGIEGKQQFFLDSLKYQVRAMENRLISNPGDKEGESILSNLYQQYSQVSKDFDESKIAVVKQYNNQVLNNIRERGKTFSEEHGWTVFLGISAKNDLTFADKGLEQTDEFLKYLNENYSGQ